MINIRVTNYNRHAQHEWKCDKCGRLISKGERYMDQEHKKSYETYTGMNVKISHRRLCQYCAGYTELPLKFIIKGEEPVTFFDVKEWLVGKGFNRERRKCLLTMDWDRGEYHWRAAVCDAEGHSMHYNNVEFV